MAGTYMSGNKSGFVAFTTNKCLSVLLSGVLLPPCVTQKSRNTSRKDRDCRSNSHAPRYFWLRDHPIPFPPPVGWDHQQTGSSLGVVLPVLGKEV